MRDDADFAGWYTDRALTVPFDPTVPVTEDLELFPRWAPKGMLMYGDVNQDGTVDAKDALLVLKAAVGKATLTNEQRVLANVDGDGAINAKDALLILKKAVNKIDKFPVEA